MTFTGVSGNKCGVWFFVDVFKNKKTLLSLRTLSYYYQLAVRLFGLLLNCMCVDILHGNVLPIHVCSLCTIFPPFQIFLVAFVHLVLLTFKPLLVKSIVV